MNIAGRMLQAQENSVLHADRHFLRVYWKTVYYFLCCVGSNYVSEQTYFC